MPCSANAPRPKHSARRPQALFCNAGGGHLHARRLCVLLCPGCCRRASGGLGCAGLTEPHPGLVSCTPQRHPRPVRVSACPIGLICLLLPRRQLPYCQGVQYSGEESGSEGHNHASPACGLHPLTVSTAITLQCAESTAITIQRTESTAITIQRATADPARTRGTSRQWTRGWR